ncbi:MAG: YicC family protein, partial [Muribaculaceae bacterium]|nr:YicC family protein [Muribaculaceae bacterium]
MLLSMTGFGKAIVELPTKKITVEIKSLNSKQLDLSLRVPPTLREHEMELRNIIARNLERGKVEASVYVENTAGDTSVQFNIPLMKAYKAQYELMAKELGIAEPQDWYSLIVRFPDVLKSDVPTETDSSTVEAVTNAMQQAVDALMEYRRAEGHKLDEFFSTRIEKIRSLLSEVPKYENERVARIRARLEEHLTKLPQIEYDRSRLEQEMIFYIEKLDINEEKQRLTQHLNYFLDTMKAPHGQGKKLGFISQEMGREINTLGSKSNHAEMQCLVVRMKDELEQIKEQV